MRVFVDTNVWLAGRFRPGLCAELLEALVALGAVADMPIVDPRRAYERLHGLS